MFFGPTNMLSTMIPMIMKDSDLNFGWVNVGTVQKTIERSTEWGVSIPNTFPMKRHLKSRNPALNILRRHEPVATDTIFSDTPAEDSELNKPKCLLVGTLLVADAYPMKSGKQFINTLEDNIRRRGAMDKLLSGSAKTEISNKVMDIFRALEFACTVPPLHTLQILLVVYQ